MVANDRVDLLVEEGEVHALLGENGAGKTTLMNILFGLTHPDEGEIRLDDVPVRFGSPKDAIAAGIGMVHQHFMLVPVFTVTENIVLGPGAGRPAGFAGPHGGRTRRRASSRAASGSTYRPTRSWRICRSASSSASRS